MAPVDVVRGPARSPPGAGCGIDGEMAHAHFYRAEAQRRTVEAVHRIEGQTSVRVVVALRSHAASYRETDFLFGVGCALATLLTVLYLPVSFGSDALPLDVAVGFGLGVSLSSALAPLRRLLTPRRRLEESVHGAACVAFVDQGLARRRARPAILIYAGLFERRAELLCGAGVDAAPLGAAVAELERSLREGPDLDRFIAALEAFGPILGQGCPPGAAVRPERREAIA